MGSPTGECSTLAACANGDRDGSGTITALEIFFATQNSVDPNIRGEC
jgi:hypothetical protein